ncbi:MAG: LCP family protein [Nitriliruptoraceae bacterium]
MSEENAASGWGPEIEARRRRVPFVRILLVLLVLLLVVALIFALWLPTRLAREPVDGLARGGGSPRHILVTGSDSREGLSPEEQRELSTGSASTFEGERTDTIFVLTVEGDRTAMLAFPRDLWVERCDGTLGRINAAMGIGGPSCLVETIRDVSGIHVHHHARITFGGFRDVVDAVGGVELCLDEPIADRDAGIDLPAGCQVLDGTDALGYVRVRKIDDDLQRIQRQQRFVRALATEVTQPSVLLNPLTLWRLSGDMGQAVTVDDSLGLPGLVRLARGARALAGGNVVTHTVPVAPRTTSGGAYVLDPQQPDAETLFARFRDGSVLDEVVTEDENGQTPAREDIRVSVANGAGVAGLAGSIADELAALGYEIDAVTNAEPTERTVVRHPPGDRPAAERVAGDLPGASTLQETDEVTHVTIVLSSDAAEDQ